MIDVALGGQYGDEGKGQVVAHLTLAKNYYFAVRAGGSNAEHRFNTPDNKRFTARVIPSSAWVDPDIKLVLAAGHMIKLDSLRREITQLEELWGKDNVRERLFIDGQAGVIPPDYAGRDDETAWRGSTHQGVGKSVAQKVRRTGDFKLAEDYRELRSYTTDTVMLMNRWLRVGKRGLFEGSQGALLSLDLGAYPFNTSKNITPAGMLGEAGISARYLNDVYSIYRTVPMRVPGNSGPTGGREMTWEELERRANIDIPEHKKIQTDSPKDAPERVFEWSWDDFERSVAIVGPDYLVFTFLDWYEGNEKQLMSVASQMAEAPVVLTRNGPKWEDYETHGRMGEGV